MKKRNPLASMLMIMVITLSMLIVFSSRIASKPTDAGFWMIFVFGASVGVALTGIINWYKQKKGNK